MRPTEGLQIAMRLKNVSIDLLAVEIAEIYHKHDKGEKLDNKERFLIGLVYSEFLAEDTSDSGYYRADVQKMEFLKILELDSKELREKVEGLL